VHGNMEVPMVMGFPREWELDLNKDGNRNGNKTTREWEWLMLVGSQNHSRGLVKSHHTTLCAPCLTKQCGLAVTFVTLVTLIFF